MSYVYFIRAIGIADGPVKIGCSRRPGDRLAALETWTPFPLEIVAQIAGNGQLERRFHAKFEAQHTHREWFAWSPELQAVIDEIVRGDFNIDSLPAPKVLHRRKSGRAPGYAWTEEQKAAARRRHALSKAERQSGLVCDYPHTAERVDAFIADPHRHGVTRAERQQGAAIRVARYQIERVHDTLIAQGVDPSIIPTPTPKAAA